jgi:hypothetical protein
MFEYKSPIENGYKRFYLTKKDHNKLFPKRKTTILRKNEYYILEDKQIIIHSFLSLFAKLLATITLPFAIIINLSSTKEVLGEYKGILFQKKYGTFVSDLIVNKSRINEIMGLSKKEKFDKKRKI